MPRPLPPPAPRTRWSAPVVAACATALLATGCAADSAADSPAGTTGAGPAPTGGHGYVAGAEELGEPQLQLTHLDEAGSVHALDLLTGESAPVGEVGRTDAVASDGRFLFTSGPAGRLSVVDTGTWTVDHGDHVHYYRAPARVVGTLAWSGEVRAASSETLTALFSPTTGAGVVLDRAALGQGEIETVATSAGVPHDGALVPLGSRVVATGPASVEVREDGGDPTGTEAPCTDPRGGAATRVGVVVSCADGAVLATETAEGVTLERIPYPSPVADGDRAVSLANRAGRPVLAAPAGQHGVWLLDTRARSWQL
ncbi:ABC transporter, partial [Modestobacter versicolor]